MTHRDRVLTHWDKYSGDLINAMTVNEIAEIWSKHYKTVVRAIDTGALFAVKKDAPISDPRGVWLVSYQSAVDLWGEPLHEIDMQYNHVEPSIGGR